MYQTRAFCAIIKWRPDGSGLDPRLTASRGLGSGSTHADVSLILNTQDLISPVSVGMSCMV